MTRRPDPAFGAEPEELDDVDALIMFEDPQPVDDAVEEYRGRHRREVPKATKLARLRKAWRRR